MLSLKSVFGPNSDILRDTNLQVLLFANLNVLMGLTLISPILDSLVEPFGATEATIGLVVTLYTAPGIFVIPIAGAMADRFGRKPVLIAGLLLFGVSGTAIALLNDFRAILALRLLQGAGYGCIFPIVITSIGDLYTGAEEATAQGFRLAASGTGNTVFPVFGGLLIVIGWRFPFLLYALAIPTALAVYLWFTESRTPNGGDRDGPDLDRRAYLSDLFRLVVDDGLVVVLIALGASVFLFISFLTYNSFVVTEIINGTPQQAGILVATCSVLYASVATQVGRLVDWAGDRFLPLVGANVCYGAGFVVLTSARTFPVAELGAIGIGIGFGITGTLYRSIITDAASETLRGGLVSLGETCGRIAATTAPVVIGVALQISRRTMAFADALQLVLSVIGVAGGVIGILCVVALR